MARLNMRIDDVLKEEANELFSELGMDLTTAVVIFLKQSVREQRLPFQPSKEPFENVIARYQADEKMGEVYDTVAEFMDSLEDED
jgi:addiction module antitoxin, RelB/DinJ family